MDNYELIKVVGKGTFGKALLVRNKKTSTLQIMKQVSMSQLSSKERQEALNEVKVLSRLKHKYIVRYRNSFEDKGFLCIVMDYAENGDLYQKITQRRGKLFTEKTIMKWFSQMCLALHYVHRQHILHRDLKTQNIFLTKNDDIAIGDFGIARVLQSTMECARTMVGTPYYLSPELCREEPYNHKSDIWALGCILYELTTHRHAFEANSMKGLVGKILRGIYPPISSTYSLDLKRLIDSMLQKDARRRPSVEDILNTPFVRNYAQSLQPSDQPYYSQESEPSREPPSHLIKRVKPSKPESRQRRPPSHPEPINEKREAEIKAIMLEKMKQKQQAQEREAQERKKRALEYMQAKREKMEKERKQMEKEAENRRRHYEEQQRRQAIEQQRHDRERAAMAERERRRIWEENRAAAMRNKQRLHEHLYGGGNNLFQDDSPHDIEPSRPDRPDRPDREVDNHPKKDKSSEDDLAEFRRKQFWEAKLQAMKNRQRVQEQLNNPSVIQEEDTFVPNQEKDPRSKLIEEKRRKIEEKMAQRQRDLEQNREENRKKRYDDAREFFPDYQPDQDLQPDTDDVDQLDDYSPSVRTIISRDEARQDKFQLNGQTFKMDGVTSKDSLCFRIESLRMYLEQELGPDRFSAAYDIMLNQGENDSDEELHENLVKIIGEDKLGYCSLIHQLIFVEECFNCNI